MIQITDGELDDRLVSILFPDKTQIDVEYERYLSHLTNMSLEKLSKEPERLSQDGRQIKEEMEKMAFKNYKSFIQTANCVQDLHKEVCHSFIVGKRKRNKFVYF